MEPTSPVLSVIVFTPKKRRIIESSDEETLVDESSDIPSGDGGPQGSQTLDESQHEDGAADDEMVRQATQANTPSEDDGSRVDQDDGSQGDQEGNQNVVDIDLEREIEAEEDVYEFFRFGAIERKAKDLRQRVEFLCDDIIRLAKYNPKA